eukprot:TRINITY_DN15712_c0_g1_i1.p1 TRINITY_DN15712_c0_g1~~TRINITY_DN15712_c0_g1_i1.p1  ORF type:complete len:340 (+),score=126.87 TRINITY_DN15712_c0_g1_i1:103-1122(+)
MLRACALLLASAAAAAGKPVQVYILMGQSNMLGEGHIGPDNQNGTLGYAVKTEHKYPYLWDSAAGAWAVRKDVRNVFIMGSGNASFENSKLQHNEWMTVSGTTIGPELGIGNYLGNYTGGDLMILKSCIGNRALGWDLLPPGSKRWDYTDSKGQEWTYAGYHDVAEKWQKGTVPKPVNWMAGEQYDGDTNRTAHILTNLATYYPGATDYEVAGFFWWQGDKDHYDEGLSERYEFNLVNLIKTLRAQFKAPNAKFVTASLGQTVMGSNSTDGKILGAMLNVDGKSGKYPEFKGNVAAVYTHPYSMGGSSSAHYNGNAETYMNVGQAMGNAMVELLKGDAH